MTDAIPPLCKPANSETHTGDEKPIRTSMYCPNTNERNAPALSSYFAHDDLGQIMLAWRGLVNPLVFKGPGLRVLYDVK